MRGDAFDTSKYGRNPFLKWPGGKRWLAPVLAHVFKDKFTGKYYEPFLGSGSVFFRLQPKNACLSDINRDLISCFETVRENPNEVIRAIWRYSNTENCYYRVRSSKTRTPVTAAARFVYLNRTCWGGISRFNSQGEFNVPFGNSGRRICSATLLNNSAKALKKAKINCQDFEDTINDAEEGDAIYADPPYTIQGQNNGFLRFNDNLFTWDDQVRLAKACGRARRRGVFVAVSQIWHADLLGLYRGWWAVKIPRWSLVSPEPQQRRVIAELLVVSMKPNISPLHAENVSHIKL